MSFATQLLQNSLTTIAEEETKPLTETGNNLFVTSF